MKLPIIPRPQSVILKEGKIRTDVPINYHSDLTLPCEGYRIRLSENGAEIFAGDSAGKFYAQKTLAMLKEELGYYPVCEIDDAPKNRFRCVMLDSGRYYFPVDTVKTLIDDASQLKLNVLYWHLSEDQGWRAEIDSRPRLKEIGSKREKTNGFPLPSKGCYTKAEMREIVRYAQERSMTVIPEIDVPGHVRAALAAYPDLACFPRDFTVATHFGVKHDILCAGKEDTYRFLYDVFSELSEIFTDGYFGLGGDEAVKMRWKICPDCQKVIQENGLRDEDDLQTFFMNRLNREFFAPRGIKLVIWVHGKAPDRLDKDFVCMYYGGENTVAQMKKSAEEGYRVLNADSEYFYFDFPHARTSLKKAYEGGKNCDPFENLLGGTLSLWSEYIPRQKTLEKRMFPRILAGAEALWTKYDEKEYNGFVERAARYAEVYGRGRNFTPTECSEPKGLRALAEKIWWARRPLHWEGLHQLFDDAKVRRIYKKQSKNKEAL